VLALVVIFAPNSFRAGVAAWVQIETQVVLKRLAPALDLNTNDHPPVPTPANIPLR